VLAAHLIPQAVQVFIAQNILEYAIKVIEVGHAG
jgi:hypothetical protein